METALRIASWLDSAFSYVLIPNPVSHPALDAFEALITDRLDHPAFSQFGKVEVTAQEAKNWSEGWALDQVTEAEKRVMTEMLLGSGAPLTRRKGCALMLAAAAHAMTTDVASIRREMAGAPSNFVPPNDLDSASEAWRRTQVRQLFRLSLEALLFWTIMQIEDGPRSTAALVNAFLEQAAGPERETARDWLDVRGVGGDGPTTLIDRIEKALENPSPANLVSTIVDALSFCIAEAPEHGQIFERSDRLPLFRARREAEAWGKTPVKEFVRHILESWVLAQHVYWSIGRGLADARAGGKTILRLKIVMEEAGWTLAPGASRRSPPVPTPDRLQTAMSIATECGLLAAYA